MRWFAEHRRDFAWRRTRDPYRILVSELMLQQTQTSRVEPLYRAFLRRFPSVEELAGASAGEVIRAWRGLGYNRRAVALHRTAQAIVRDHDGAVPADPATLRSLPGIGPYTALAVACFAFDAQVAVVDTNVRRVLARAAHGQEPAGVAAAQVASTAAVWVPRGHAYEWNQALMDIGATVCRSRRPACATCPLRVPCAYRRAGSAGSPDGRHAARSERFEGSRRQVRGAVVEELRRRPGATTFAALSRAVPSRQLAAILVDLESEGLVVLSRRARGGAPRSTVRLP